MQDNASHSMSLIKLKKMLLCPRQMDYMNIHVSVSRVFEPYMNH